MSAALNLVVCSLEPWDDVWRRNQHLLDGLLQDDGVEVLLVEPAADPLHALAHRRRPRRGRGLRTLPGYGGRLRAIQPTKYGPRALGPAAQSRMRAQVLRAVAALGWKRPVLWINDPLWSSLLDLGWPSLYDITDDWAAADRPRRVHERIVRAERVLLDGVDAVVVCSPTLRHRKGGTIVQNGVDVNLYRRPTDRPADLPRGPVAVYVGTLHEDRLDVDLVVSTASALADAGATLALVGPDALSRDASARLRAAAGIRVLGARAAAEVPAYMQHADALIVPHVVTPFTDSLDPIKLYEYLAAGRPVVSTPVAGFRDAKGRRGLEITSANEFPRAVVAAATGARPSIEHPDIPTWADRAAQMRAVIQSIVLGVTL